MVGLGNTTDRPIAAEESLQFEEEKKAFEVSDETLEEGETDRSSVA
jgi:hypothetical protein